MATGPRGQSTTSVASRSSSVMMTFARSQSVHFASAPARCPTTTWGRWASASFSLSARLARFSFWTARALRLRKVATWTTAEEWNEDCVLDEATVRPSDPIQTKRVGTRPPIAHMEETYGSRLPSTSLVTLSGTAAASAEGYLPN